MDSVPQKRCHVCGEYFSPTKEYFTANKTKKDGIDSCCHACNRERVRLYKVNHPDKVAEGKRRDRIEHKDRIQKQQQAWVEKNPSKNRATKKRYVDRHPDKVKQNNKDNKFKRRATLRKLPFDFNALDWQHCLEYWDYRCCICGRKADFWHMLAREHWIAIEDHRENNPGTVPSNMLPMCHSIKGASPDDVGCNNAKRDKDPIEWLNKRLGKRKAKVVLKRIDDYFKTVR